MSSDVVAKEIYRQLGGGKFTVMTGAKNFVYDDNSLWFHIPRNASKANYVKITLNGKDLYDVEFRTVRLGRFSLKTGKMSKDVNNIVKRFDDVYCNMLQSIFTEVTGMYTRLF